MEWSGTLCLPLPRQQQELMSQAQLLQAAAVDLVLLMQACAGALSAVEVLLLLCRHNIPAQLVLSVCCVYTKADAPDGAASSVRPEPLASRCRL